MRKGDHFAPLLARTYDRMKELPLAEWDKDNLRKEYVLWSSYETNSPEATRIKQAIIQLIHKASLFHECFGFVLTGQEYESKNSLKLRPVAVSEVKKDNPDVGNYFDTFLMEWGGMENATSRQLLVLYKQWQNVQKQFELPAKYLSKDADSYSPAARAVFKILETIEQKLKGKSVLSVATRARLMTPPEIMPPLQVVESLEVIRQRNRERFAEEARIAFDHAEAHRPRPAVVDEEDGESVDVGQSLSSDSSVRAIEEKIDRRYQETLAHQREAMLQQKKDARKPSWDMTESERNDYFNRLKKSEIFEDPKDLAGAASRGAKPRFSDRALSAEGYYGSPEAPSSHNGERFYADVKKEMLATDDWSEYGWTAEQKTRAVEAFQTAVGSEANAKQVMAALLLHGYTGEQVVSVVLPRLLQKDKNDNADPLGQLYDYLHNQDILKNDDDILELLPLSSQFKLQYRDGRFQEEPPNVEELAWQMQYKVHSIFGEHGPYTILERHVQESEEKGVKKFAFRDRVNAANMVMWFRERALTKHGQSSTKPLDFESEVSLHKKFGKVDVYLLLNDVDLLQSKHGPSEDLKWIADHMEVEAIALGWPRAAAIEILQGGMGDRKKLMELRTKYFADNLYTRPIGPKSMLAHLYGLGESVTNRKDMDGKLGAVVSRIESAYNNISNPQELFKLLGLQTTEDITAAFGLDNLRRVRDQLADDKTQSNGTYCNLDANSKIHGVKVGDVFDADGNPKIANASEQLNFIKFINFYGQPTAHEQFKLVIRTIISERAAEMHGLVNSIDGTKVDINRKYAEMLAYNNTWFMGTAGWNDIADAGYNAEAKTTNRYRHKIAGREEGGEGGGRGGKYGNIWNFSWFKRWLLPPGHVIHTTVVDPETGKERSILQTMEVANATRARNDALLRQRVEAMDLDEAISHKIQHIKDHRHHTGETSLADDELYRIARGEVVRQKMTELLTSEEGKTMRSEYQDRTNEFIFNENAMYDYSGNHYARGMKIDERLHDAKSLKFDKYITYVPFVGAAFNQEAWQDDMATFITDARYLLKESKIDYTSRIWDWDPKAKQMKHMMMGESLFGQQLYNIAEFRNKSGGIDWEKVNGDKGRKILYKRWMEGFIIAQLLEYRELRTWSSNQRYSFTMTEDILEAIGKIPGWVEFDENDARNTHVKGFFFDKAAMKRIRKESGTTKLKMYGLEILTVGLFGKEGAKDEGFLSGLNDGFSKWANGIFSKIGYA